MSSSYQDFMDGLSGGVVNDRRKDQGGLVQSMDRTSRQWANIEETDPSVSVEQEAEMDRMFGKSAGSYRAIKKESFKHRLILWATIQGHKSDEIAMLVRVTRHTVQSVQAQPWFKEAFCRITAEMGQDVFKKTLEGYALPALERIENLSRTAESDAVKLSANKEILDRFLGKATVKVETEGKVKVDHMVHDADALLREQAALQKQLAARGIGNGSN